VLAGEGSRSWRRAPAVDGRARLDPPGIVGDLLEAMRAVVTPPGIALDVMEQNRPRTADS